MISPRSIQASNTNRMQQAIFICLLAYMYIQHLYVYTTAMVKKEEVVNLKGSRHGRVGRERNDVINVFVNLIKFRICQYFKQKNSVEPTWWCNQSSLVN